MRLRADAREFVSLGVKIEVRGNRNDIDDIVGQVIDEIRKEKQQ